MIQTFIHWANQQPLVRAVLLTSTRAIPGTIPDRLSDYDIILILSDVLPYHQSRAWLEDFGPVLSLYHDPLQEENGFLTTGYVVQYDGDLKIDFSLWPVGYWQRVAADAQLLPELDAGYQVLLDKDQLTQGLQPPSYRAYIPTPPDESRYQDTIENFMLVAVYVAKYLWRDDLFAAKYVLENFLKQEHLLPMLEWHFEIAHGWTVKPGPYGRGLKRWLRPDLWAALERTYTGPTLKENWDALQQTITLMHITAQEVGEHLGFAYPHEMERRTLAQLARIQTLPHDA